MLCSIDVELTTMKRNKYYYLNLNFGPELVYNQLQMRKKSTKTGSLLKIDQRLYMFWYTSQIINLKELVHFFITFSRRCPFLLTRNTFFSPPRWQFLITQYFFLTLFDCLICKWSLLWLLLIVSSSSLCFWWWMYGWEKIFHWILKIWLFLKKKVW